MNAKALILVVVLFCFIPNFTNAQRQERYRPLSLRDQLIMKIDSIDRMLLMLHSREHFEAKRKLDGIIQLFDKREFELQQRERTLKDKDLDLQDREQELDDREQTLDDREKALEERGRGDQHRDRDWNNNRDRNKDKPREADILSSISQEDLNQLTAAIDNASFAQDKKGVIRTAAPYHYFMVDQVVRLASKFSFDNDKLDVIETLYPKIIDINKNYLLYNCFTFSDAKNKLEKFIEASNRPPVGR